MNTDNLAPMRNCPGLQGRPNLMPGYTFKEKKNKLTSKQYPCTPKFYLIKVEFDGGLIYMGMLAQCIVSKSEIKVLILDPVA